MTRIKILVEGQTEETFVRDVLIPRFRSQNKWLVPILAKTCASGRGGIVSYGKIKHQVTRLCRKDKGAYVTTMIDLYGLPMDFPGRNSAPQGSCFDRARYLEQEFSQNINEINFIPNLLVHEFEGLLFSEPEKFGEWFVESVVTSLVEINNSFSSPEEINDSPQTAPSKRIQAVTRGYQKTLHGPLIGYDIGLDTIRNKCTHFGNWLAKLERL